MKCTNCNTKNSINSKYCSNCGFELPNYLNFFYKCILLFLLKFKKFIIKNFKMILLFVIAISLMKIAFCGIKINGDIYTNSKIEGGYLESVTISDY